MAYTVPYRVYRTADGRLVGHNDPDAAFLAHTEGEQLSDDEAKRLGLLAFEKKMRGDVQDKQAEKPVDKAVEKSAADKVADKSAAGSARAVRTSGKIGNQS